MPFDGPYGLPLGSMPGVMLPLPDREEKMLLGRVIPSQEPFQERLESRLAPALTEDQVRRILREELTTLFKIAGLIPLVP